MSYIYIPISRKDYYVFLGYFSISYIGVSILLAEWTFDWIWGTRPGNNAAQSVIFLEMVW